MNAPDPDLQFVRQRVREASTLTRHPEARDRLREALAELSDELGEPIEQCEACAMLGTRETLETHDCPAWPR